MSIVCNSETAGNGLILDSAKADSVPKHRNKLGSAFR
jgi:hypothetical protein